MIVHYKWLIAYRNDGLWVTLTNIPHVISDDTIEMILKDLNKEFDIVYYPIEKGIVQKNKKVIAKKGEFICL